MAFALFHLGIEDAALESFFGATTITEAIEGLSKHLPGPEDFRRNANTAIQHVEGSPQYNSLLPLLNDYVSFIDSLPQK